MARKNRAYSLLEMLIAGFIFATVAVALAGVFSYHYRAIGTSRLFLVAQHLARTRMEECLAAGGQKPGLLTSALLFDDGGTPTVVDVEFVIQDQEILTQFSIATSVVPSAGPPAGHLLCTVTVSWNEANRTRNVKYCASISPRA